jgi:hypothetical protein
MQRDNFATLDAPCARRTAPTAENSSPWLAPISRVTYQPISPSMRCFASQATTADYTRVRRVALRCPQPGTVDFKSLLRENHKCCRSRPYGRKFEHFDGVKSRKESGPYISPVAAWWDGRPGKHVEIARELFPTVAVIGVLVNPANAASASITARNRPISRSARHRPQQS